MYYKTRYDIFFWYSLIFTLTLSKTYRRQYHFKHNCFLQYRIKLLKQYISKFLNYKLLKKILFALMVLLCISCSKNDLENSGDLSQILFNGSDYELTEKNIPDWNGLGIYCVLTNGNLQKLQVMDNNGIVKDAQVELYSKGNLLGKFDFEASTSSYTLKYTPKEGEEYIMKLSCNGKSIEAKAVMPKKIERKFVCNPLLIPKVYKESIFLDKESGYENEVANEDFFNILFDRYPSYTFTSNDNKGTAYTYFIKEGKIVDQLFSTHANTHNFNKADNDFTFDYLAVLSPDKVEGQEFRAVLDASYWKKAKYDYLQNFARIELDGQTINPYHLASYADNVQSCPELFKEEIDYVLEIIDNNPEYGCIDKKCEFWGPDFFVMPYTGKNMVIGLTIPEKHLKVNKEADKQIVMSVSNELDIYLMNSMDFKFDDLAEIKSNFTNITGGYGIFGAAYVDEYDFTNYYEDLRDAYFEIIGNLETMPPFGYYGYEYGKFW